LLLATASSAQDSSSKDSLDRNYADELPRIAPTEPEDVLATFEVHPDFELKLVAAEPLIHDPIAMAFDEYGRMFVVEMRGYSELRDENLGTVRVLEDKDGDGVYDKSTVYIDGLQWPTAVACYDGGIFIGMAPDILYAKDTDGDGKADVKEVVYSGFGLQNVQGLLNTFKWGLDNRMHGAGSSTGGIIRRNTAEDSTPVNINGRDFAFDPRTFTFQATSGGAQHGLSFDDWGRKFLCHNSDNCMLVMYDERYVARNPYYGAPRARISIAADGPAADVFRISPVEPWRIVRTRLRVQGLVPGPVEGGGTAAGYFTSATGITVFKGDAWPEAYHNNVIIGDVGSNLIHRKVVEENGVELIADRADPDTEFVRSTDIWFRPVQFCNAPDGSLYVADMYREIIEHPASLHPIIKQHLDLTSGHDRGRIYRIVAKGKPYAAPEPLGDLSSAELVPFLGHPNAWHAETAARLLYERRDASVKDGLATSATKGESHTGTVRALYTLNDLDALSPYVVLSAMRHSNPRVREHGVRLAESQLDDEAVRILLLEMADDPDPRVQYQVAYTLGYLNGADRNRALATLATRHADDRWFRVAVLSSSYQGAGEVLALLLGAEDFRARDVASEWVEELARVAGAVSAPEVLRGVLAQVDTLATDQEALAAAAVRGLLQGAKTAKKGAAVRAVFAASDQASALLTATLQSAQTTAVDTDRKEGERVDAIRSMGFAPFAEAHAVLSPLLSQREPDGVQVAALQILGGFEGTGVVSDILNGWSGYSPRLRSTALEVLFASDGRTTSVLDAIASGSFNPKQLPSTRIRALQDHPSENIRTQASTILAEFDFGSREAVVEAYRPALALTGDSEKGLSIFSENCSPCHRLKKVGYEVGPDLATVAQAGAEKILVNVLDPNREINPQYINYTVQAGVWETHTGIIASETATSITLKRASGESDTILRANIDSIESANLSIMPEGWEETIDHQAMADLIAYIMAEAQ
jgi:putative membrane-bound dehydrogenase-like protein